MIVTSDVKIEEKLGLYEKPFSQDEVNYRLTSDVPPSRCEICRFFRHGNIYDPCLIVPFSPLPVVTGGVCSQFLPIKEDFETLLFLGEESLVIGVDGEYDKGARLNEEMELNGARGFKMFGSNEDYWLSWYSNNFEDKDGEFFATESNDYFNMMTSKGFYPQPELWAYHQKYLKHGVSKKTFRLGHFQLAVGKFDDPSENHLVNPFRDFYRTNKVTMSHGYMYNPKFFKDRTYYRHRTFELSTLKPGREANPFFTSLTNLEESNGA